MLYVIYHILSWIKVLYTDVFLDKTSFLFMQVDGCITKYAKIAYLWINVRFINIPKSHILGFIWGYSDSVSSCASRELNSSSISD